jgi:MFS family permease
MVGRFSSLYAAASISGMFLAPAIGGTVYDHAPRLLYPAAAVLAVAAAAVLYRQPVLRKPATQPQLSGGGEPGAT